MAHVNFNVYARLNSPVEEAYKVLRTNIQFCGVDKKIKTVAITSCNPGEGKSTTAINLSVSFARSGKKVLLIDADLRKPMAMKRLGSNFNSGLSNYITRFAKLEEIMNTTNIENLTYIPCGPKPPNPAELLGTQVFSDFLKDMEERFYIIIIDTPPLGKCYRLCDYSCSDEWNTHRNWIK